MLTKWCDVGRAGIGGRWWIILQSEIGGFRRTVFGWRKVAFGGGDRVRVGRGYFGVVRVMVGEPGFVVDGDGDVDAAFEAVVGRMAEHTATLFPQYATEEELDQIAVELVKSALKATSGAKA